MLWDHLGTVPQNLLFVGSANSISVTGSQMDSNLCVGAFKNWISFFHILNYHRLSALKQHRLVTFQWWRAEAGHSILALDLGTYQVKAKVVLAWLCHGSTAPAALPNSLVAGNCLITTRTGSPSSCSSLIRSLSPQKSPAALCNMAVDTAFLLFALWGGGYHPAPK